MSVEVIVRIEGQEVASIEQSVSTSEASELEEQVEQLKDRRERVVLEVGGDGWARSGQRGRV